MPYPNGFTRTNLQTVVVDAAAKVVVYERNNKRYVATLSPTVLPEERQGDQLEPWLCVIYSIDDGKIITGYQIEKVEDQKIRDKAKWLK